MAPPTPLEPEDGAPFSGETANFRLAWRSGYTLRPNEYYEVQVRYVNQGANVVLPVRVQQTYWWVDKALYLQADQETNRAYHWTVRLVRKGTDSEGNEVWLPFSPASEEWSFFWR
jgi:hypothetical protein